MDDNKNLLLAMDEAGKEFVKALQDQVKGYSDTGKLVASMDYNTVSKANTITTSILANSYLQEIDKGRKKGVAPPISAIMPWVRRKGITIPGADLKQTAFVIARSIGRKGIKGHDVINKAKNKVMDDIKNIVALGAEKDIIQIINSTFADIN